MRISQLFDQKKLVLSCEVFPPKPETPVQSIYDTLDALKDLRPDFISVTYGAAGMQATRELALDLTCYIKNELGVESLSHLTCIGATHESIEKITARLSENGIENILALRGDLPDEGDVPTDFTHACDLIGKLKSEGRFHIAAACYPECHPTAPSLEADLLHLKEKVDCGAEHLITQLFFDNDDFYRFREKAVKLGIHVPIQAGIMPVLGAKQIRRITSLCGSRIPPKYLRMIERYENDKVALRDASIAYATDQIVDLISNGVDGIHLYSMNNATVAKRILHNVESVRQSVNREGIAC